MSTRRTIAAAVAATVVASALILLAVRPTVYAAPGPERVIKIVGLCNPASVAMAKLIDKQLAADKKPFRMIQENQPKKGESGYVDLTVAYAVDQLAKALGKELTQITEDDIAKNDEKVKAAIAAALKWRADNGDTTATEPADLAGNKIYLWCLLAGNGHGGPDLALLFVPPKKEPKDGLWIGAALLPGAVNKYVVSHDDKTFDYAFFGWFSEAPDPKKKGDFIRYTFIYDVAKNKLTIIKEVGPYKNGAFDPHTRIEEKNPAAPPTDFNQLKLNGDKIALQDGGSIGPLQPGLVAALDPAVPMLMALTNPIIAGTGSEDDPFVGISFTLDPRSVIKVIMPEGTLFAGAGSNPLWTVLESFGSTIMVRYEGTEPLSVAVEDQFLDIAWLQPAPSEPPPSEPAPSDPAPSDPAPSDPAPSEPGGGPPVLPPSVGPVLPTFADR